MRLNFELSLKLKMQGFAPIKYEMGREIAGQARNDAIGWVRVI